ncbi:Alg9-like mannosyltransferase family-domain-containing protein [Phaeosphaeriaceae sp. PMI808]|nr:Alg9-like mannosyltransferase family-domain-containing protein [Phaeosphaeriaceae sp. PMI808]
MPLPTWPFYALIPSFILIHLFVSPYTKVEESFNIQAIHDIIVHGIPTENADQFLTANYDHVSFPGSVPRTFAGALLLSGLSRPYVALVKDGEQMQLVVRSVLGLINAAALIAFGRSVQRAFGKSAGIWFTLFQASQFHVIYYASRTLPNMFALIFSNLALRSLLNASSLPWEGSRGYRLSLYLLTVAGIVFRSELAILLGTITLYLLISQKISIIKVIIPAGLGGLIIGLLCTVPLDSFFWQSFPLWPEWTGFYYNTIQGHSADWGVSPWHFYIANALPRLLLNPAVYVLCIPIAVMNVATRGPSLDLLIPSLAFVGLYSFLPHKEWRFIIYVIPGLTGVAAAGASWIWTRRTKSVVYATLSLVLVSSVMISFAASTSVLALSSLNYPGGVALNVLHHGVEHPKKSHINVYFDNLACQTGVTRFLESHHGAQTILDVLETRDILAKRTWSYDKTEDPSALLDPMFWARFDYVLAERPEKIIGGWAVAHVVYGYGGVHILRPGEESSSTIEPVYNGATPVNVSQGWPDMVAKGWKRLEGLLRTRVLMGYWVEVRMVPKIHILVNQRNI